MRKLMAANVAHWVVRISGLLQLVFGVVIWTGAADQLIPWHIADGVVLVLALWTLAALAVGRAPNQLVVVAIAWGFLMPALGLTHTGLLTGNLHWTIQVVHVLVGLAAIGQGEGLARAIGATKPSVGARP